jgi:hypothetical protein
LIYFGAACRFDNLLPAIGFAGAYLFVKALLERNRIRDRLARGSTAGKISLALSLVLILGLYGMNAASHAKNLSTPELERYDEYNVARARFIDYPKPNYDENEAFFENLGLDKNDYRLMQMWYFDYDKTATLENLNAINSIAKAPDREWIKDGVKPFLKNTLLEIIGKSARGYHIAFLILLAAASCVLVKRKYLLYLLVIGAATCCGYVYLYYIGRAIYRATYILDIAAFVWIAYATEFDILKDKVRDVLSGPRRKKVTYRITAAMVAALMLVEFLCFSYRIDPDRIGQEDYFYQGAESGKVYVLDPDTNYPYYIQSPYYLDPMRRLPKDFNSNVFTFGGWPTLSPYFLNQLKKNDLENLFGDVVDNPNVYVIDSNHAKRAQKYFRKHYNFKGKVVYYDHVAYRNGLHIYQIKTKDKKKKVESND